MFKDKTAIVTGASRGIGRACALLLAREGAKVLVNYRQSKDKASEVVEKIIEDGGEAFIYRADVSNEKKVNAMAKNALDRFGSIDVLVNNAGIAHSGGHLREINLDDFEPLMSVNVKGIISCCKAVAPSMKKKGTGSIVNIASVAGLGTARRPVNMLYSSTKAAVIVLTKNLAMDLGPYGIRVNAVAPGLIVTDMALRGKPLEDQKERLDYYREHSVLNRLGEPNEIAEAVTFLASNKASFITGQTLTVDGGRFDFLTHSL
jgi:3-oxoacyl-[acyl-carrier protein] reductase